MFALDKHEAKITNINLRAEKHGSERKLGVDISLKLQAGNGSLDGLEKGLRQSLFRKAQKGEQIDLIEGADGLVAVKHPCLGSIPINGEYTGYEVDIDGMLEATETLPLVDVKLKNFVIDALEGGSVVISFKAQALVDLDEIAELADAFIRETVRVTLTPPTAQAEGAANDDAGEQKEAA